MPSDGLYDLAFQFKQAKLWKTLYDSELFAVRHADGSIGYCCVMGMMGEHLALAVYPGDDGIDSHRLVGKDRSRMSDLEVREAALSQNCVMVSFENKSELRPKEIQEAGAYCTARGLTLRGRKAYPQFQRFCPHCIPWYVEDEADQVRLGEALEAAAEVSEKLHLTTPEALGFTSGAPFDRKIPLLEKKDGAFVWSQIALPPPKPPRYPSPETLNEIALAKLAKSAKRGGEWACDLFMHVQAITNEKSDTFATEPKHAPFFPFVLLVVDNQSGMVMHVQISDNPDDYAEQFAREMLDFALKMGKPTRILVCGERAHAFFSNLAARMDVKLAMKKKIPLLEEAKQEYFEHFANEEGEPGDAMERVMEMLRDPQALRAMPDEMLVQLAQIVEAGLLPGNDIIKNVRAECERRGML